jgi:hypothetical protein
MGHFNNQFYTAFVKRFFDGRQPLSQKKRDQNSVQELKILQSNRRQGNMLVVVVLMRTIQHVSR